MSDDAARKASLKKDGATSAEDDRWEDMFRRLRVYYEQHGHCQVPVRWELDPVLGRFVSNMRRIRNTQSSSERHESSILTDERISRLDEIDFKWSTKPQRHVPWEQRYEELVEFVVRFGHAQVPIGWEENIQLSHWISAQRQEYKLHQSGKKSRLNDGRIQQLNKLDFIWEAQRGGPRRKRKARVSVPAKATPSRSKLPRRESFAASMPSERESPGQSMVGRGSVSSRLPESSIQNLPTSFAFQQSYTGPYSSLGNASTTAVRQPHAGAISVSSYPQSYGASLPAPLISDSRPNQHFLPAAGIALSSVNPAHSRTPGAAELIDALNQARIANAVRNSLCLSDNVADLLRQQQLVSLLQQLLQSNSNTSAHPPVGANLEQVLQAQLPQSPLTAASFQENTGSTSFVRALLAREASVSAGLNRPTPMSTVTVPTAAEPPRGSAGKDDASGESDEAEYG